LRNANSGNVKVKKRRFQRSSVPWGVLGKNKKEKEGEVTFMAPSADRLWNVKTVSGRRSEEARKGGKKLRKCPTSRWGGGKKKMRRLKAKGDTKDSREKVGEPA